MDRTTNYNLKKPSTGDPVLVGDLNDNMDVIDTQLNAITDGIAIIANGNTHAAIAKDQAVFVKNHSSLANGLYWATAAISANGALSTSNLTADTSGGLNKLHDDITTLNSKITFGSFNLSITTSAVGSIYQDGNDRDIPITPPTAGRTLQKVIVIPTIYNRFVWVGRIGVDSATSKITRMFVFTPTQETDTSIAFDYIAFWN